MEKRLFQVLDEMNQADIENKTRTVSIGTTCMNVKTIKAGVEVTMGVDMQAGSDIVTDKAVAVLLVIDRETYNKFK